MCGKGSSGGGGFGSLAPMQQSTTQASPQAIQAYTKALGMADVAAAQPFQQYSTDPNAFVAPLTGTQQQAIGGLYGAQGAYQPYYQAAGALTGAAGTTSTPQVVGQYMSPYMQQVVQPVQQALQQQQGQQLAQQQAEAIRGGAFGGERAGLQRQVLRGQQQLGMGQALSPLYQTGYGQALQAAQGDLARQLQAGQAMGALGTGAQTAALQAPQALLGAGTLEQQTQQAGLTALYNQFLQQRAYPYQQAQFYANVAGGLGPLLGQTTYQSQAQNPFGMFLSEPGAKTGVDSQYADGGYAQDRSQPDVVGKTFDDQNIYAYRYKDGSPAQLGLMADEVQRAHPEAVGYAPTGDRMVDYAAATDTAARMGGAVKETGDYARGGLAIGGHLAYVDPSDPSASDRRRMDALLASHKAGLSGAASEYGPSGESYVTQKTYVPAGTVRAGQQLQHARFSPVQQQSGLGSALAMGDKLGSLLEKGYGAYNKYQDYKTLKSSPQEVSQPYELNRASGGIVPTSYIPEEITGQVQASEPLRPAEISERGQDKESGLSKLMSVGEKALDIGMKYGPLLAKGASALAAFSEPGMKTGVRPAARDGMGVRGDDDIFEKGIIGAESRGRQFDKEGRPLTSPAGAIGIAQVMPDTAPEAAKLAGLEFDPVRYRTDADYNAALGRAYYNKQLETFGSRDKAAAAYNAGPGALRNALRRAEREGGDYLSYLPAETRAYVPKVMGLAGARDEAGIPRITPEAVARAKSGLKLDRLAGNFTPEQRSMMALDESSREGLGGAKPKEEGGLGDYLTSEEFLIPALTGLGTAATTMLGAPTRNLGSAIGMGLGAGTVAGAQQVLATKAKQAEIEKAKQEAAKIGQEAKKIGGIDTERVQAEIDQIRAGLYQTVVVPGEGVLLFDKNNPYAGYTKIMEADGTPVPGKEHLAEAAKQSGAPTTAPTSAPAQSWEAPTVTDIPANYKPVGQAPLALDPVAAEEAKIRGYQEAEKARNLGADASRQMMRIKEMEEAVKNLESPKGGWLTKQGPWAESRLNIAKNINFLTSAITGKEALPADEIASMEVLNKDAFRLGSSAISALSGHPAASIVQQSVVATPSLANTRMGYQRLLSGLKMAAQYERDRGAFFSNYYGKFHNTQGAQELFDQLNPPEKYAQKAIAAVVLPAHLEALKKYGPNIRDKIDAIYGTGTTKVLMGQ